MHIGSLAKSWAHIKKIRKPELFIVIIIFIISFDFHSQPMIRHSMCYHLNLYIGETEFQKPKELFSSQITIFGRFQIHDWCLPNEEEIL